MNAKKRWIASLRIWMVIYPSITVLLMSTGKYLSLLPLVLRTLVITVLLVPWMVFVGLPVVEQVGRWLRRKKQIHQ